jgi:hypothetical protein
MTIENIFMNYCPLVRDSEKQEGLKIGICFEMCYPLRDYYFLIFEKN